MQAFQFSTPDPSSTAALGDLEVEGVTTFVPFPKRTYRYVIAIKNEEMSIWLEDCTTKKQWNKGALNKADYVTSLNALPGASAADYAQVTGRNGRKSLDGAPGNWNDLPRKAIPLESDRLRLELTVKIRVFQKELSTQYTFELEPVSVERIDVLESKLRDQQAELERLRHDEEAGRAPIFLETEATAKTGVGRISWNKVASGDFAVIGAEGVILVRRPGVYNVAVVVNYHATNANMKVRLLKGTDCIRSIICAYTGGHHSSCSLGCTTRIEKDAKLTVTCDSNLVETSYLSVLWVGK
ncbi:hypothetical protein BBJ28_00025911 [Nothophytophthora sp. Chile5]|nr:hypothetical protein BBJ28_00025911 [Nothophytophthora sp. Chile5]